MAYHISVKYVSGGKILWRQDGEEHVLPRNSCGSCGSAILSFGCCSQGQWSAAPSGLRSGSWAHSSNLCSHPGSCCQLHFSPASALLPYSPAFTCPAGQALSPWSCPLIQGLCLALAPFIGPDPVPDARTS